MTTKVKLYGSICKIDHKTKTVSGIMTEEVTDKAGEKMDYASSAPLFKNWSESVAKATKGKSYGNVRWMHQPVVGGKVATMNFDDDARRITIDTIPVDDETFRKIDDGFITGFSIGGNLVGKMWDDPDEDGVKRYTVDPVEVSYVDNPCLGTATIVRVMQDGAEEKVEIKPEAWEPAPEAVAEKAGQIALEKGGSYSDHMTEAKAALIEAEKAAPANAETLAAEPKETPAETPAEGELKIAAAEPEKPVDWGITQVFRCEVDGSVHTTKAEAKAHVTALQTLEKNGSPLAAAIAKVKAAMGGEGEGAAPTGKVVFENAQALKDIGVLLNSLIKTGKVEKGMYAISYLARLVAQVSDLQMMSAWEEQAEGDTESVVPAALAAAVKQLGDTLLAMTQEEVAELLAGMKDGEGADIDFVVMDDDPIVVELASRALTVVKADTALMEKSGKRNSGKDQKHIQDAHDSATKAGAKCDPDNVDKTASASVEKVAGERDVVQKKLDEAVAFIESFPAEIAKLTTRLDEKDKEIETLKAAPAPMPSLQGGSAPVAKDAPLDGGQGGQMTAEQALAIVRSMKPEHLQEIALSAAMSQPQQAYLRGGAGDAR